MWFSAGFLFARRPAQVDTQEQSGGFRPKPVIGWIAVKGVLAADNKYGFEVYWGRRVYLVRCGLRFLGEPSALRAD
ncbi:hypothetical protein Psta_4137 [Pirellula staleyi DSM 6068]|uniref:Uncharacterized protein n=1 Tax=Pirellula staleyi (strain ATCC 27377 / DSM 6068 / ICPB 4128) TaxID=530564 RepID=D2R354_PIRSD|nr:hypothetical protein Psta_4137 [Pirellula staleyi DSM 6068]